MPAPEAPRGGVPRWLAAASEGAFRLAAPAWLGAAAGLLEARSLLPQVAGGGSPGTLFLASFAFGMGAGLLVALPVELMRRGLLGVLGRPRQGPWLRHLAALSIGMLLAFQALIWLGVRFLGAGFKNHGLAGWALSIAAMLVWIACHGVHAVAAQAIARLPERVERRAAVAILAIVAASFVVGTQQALGKALWALPWRSLLGMLAGFGVLLAIGSAAHRVPPWPRVVTALLVLPALGFALPRSLARLEYAPVTRGALLSGSVVSVVPSLFERGADADGDGYSSAFGGGDCDDSDPRRNPAALELLATAADDNCDGFAPREDPTRDTLRGKLAGNGCRTAFSLPQGTNVVLAVVDAMRADRLRGYRRDVAPNLRAIAEQGVIFDRCYTPHPSTAYALPALFTGMDVRWARDVMKSQYVEVPQRRPMLQQVLARHGYRSAATYGHQLAGHAHQLTRGFDRSHEARGEPSAHVVADDAIGYIDELSGQGKPFFLYAHIYDPHWSYDLHAPEFAPWGTREKVDRYDSEIRYSDHHLGRIVAALRERGLWQKTLFVMVSDHGEEFGEHGREYHGWTMYEEVVRAVCFVHGPGVPRRVVTQPVLLQDFFPTILDLLEIDPRSPLQAVSLEPLMLGQPCERGPIVGEMQPWSRPPRKPWLWMLIDGQRKLLFDVQKNAYELYDLSSDPGERRNVMESEIRQFERARGTLHRLVTERIALPPDSEAAKVLDFGPLPPGTRQ
jgi:arylsulfatase A-like enzyme